MLKIWGQPNSINLQKVMWLVDELDLEYELIPAGGHFGGLDTPEFLAMNPHGRIPVISDNGFVIWESHAILRYLAASYGNGKFWKDDPKERSLFDRWMGWGGTNLQLDFIIGIFWGYYRTPEANRNWAAIRESTQRTNAHFLILDKILSDQHYLVGNEFSLADIPSGCMLYRYFNLAIARPSLPHVEAWYQRLQERPAYRKHIMIPFEDLYERP